MRIEEYDLMARVEDRHWWYVGLRAILDSAWRDYAPPAERLRLIDAGCGTGAVLQMLAERCRATGVDLAQQAVQRCRARGQDGTAVGSVLSLPFPDSSFDAATSFDVISHRSVPEPAAALREIHRVLKPGGVLFLNVPAFQWLFSSHDIAVYTAYRFTHPEVVSALRACSFEIVRATYWNTLLFPLVAATRLWRKVRPLESSDLINVPGEFENRLCGAALRVERMISRVCALPLGVSIFVVARKPR